MCLKARGPCQWQRRLGCCIECGDTPRRELLLQQQPQALLEDTTAASATFAIPARTDRAAAEQGAHRKWLQQPQRQQRVGRKSRCSRAWTGPDGGMERSRGDGGWELGSSTECVGVSFWRAGRRAGCIPSCGSLGVLCCWVLYDGDLPLCRRTPGGACIP